VAPNAPVNVAQLRLQVVEELADRLAALTLSRRPGARAGGSQQNCGDRNSVGWLHYAFLMTFACTRISATRSRSAPSAINSATVIVRHCAPSSIAIVWARAPASAAQ